jgi:hypothetical protein
LNDQTDTSPETAPTFPSDPISLGIYEDSSRPEARIKVLLKSGRSITGQQMAETSYGLTIGLHDWEYTIPWANVEHVAVPPSRPAAF